METKKQRPQINYDYSFKMLFELSVEGIFIEDKYGYILDCNKAGYLMFGYEKHEIIGMNISKLVPEDFAKSLPEIILKEHLTGDKYLERTNKKKDGTLFSTEICTKYTTINNFECIIAFIHDISEQKKIQQELTESKKELEKVLTTRDKFFSIISHDLKSPMQSILGFTDLIEQEIKDPSKELLLYIDNLKKSADSSYELLENLLHWTISQSNRIKPIYETFFIEPFCEKNFVLYNDLAHKKNIKILKDIEPGIKITSDKNILQFIMRNLITNAIKFTPKKGQISLIITQTKRGTTFIVKDSGVGINDIQIEKILDVNNFYSTKGTSNENGTGIGLKTCIELLKILGSELTIHSKVNEGSMFAFTLANNI